MTKTPYEKRMFNRGYKDGINGKPRRYRVDAYAQGYAQGVISRNRVLWEHHN